MIELYALLAAGYGSGYEPAGGWENVDADDDRAVVIAGETIWVRDMPDILARRVWATPYINLYRRHRNHGAPWGTKSGWLSWPAWYLDLYEAFEAVDFAVAKG